MKYPRTPHDEKKSTKLSLDEIKQVKLLHLYGKTIPKIAEMYEVTRTCIKYWVNDEWRKKEKQRLIEKQLRKQREADKTTKKRISDIDKKHKNWKRQTPEFQEYELSQKRLYRKNNPELIYKMGRKHQLRKKAQLGFRYLFNVKPTKRWNYYDHHYFRTTNQFGERQSVLIKYRTKRGIMTKLGFWNFNKCISCFYNSIFGTKLRCLGSCATTDANFDYIENRRRHDAQLIIPNVRKN